MNNRLYASLENRIQAWMDEECEEGDWPDVFVGNKTVELMATAARAVLDACEESQRHADAEREGYNELRARAIARK